MIGYLEVWINLWFQLIVKKIGRGGGDVLISKFIWVLCKEAPFQDKFLNMVHKLAQELMSELSASIAFLFSITLDTSDWNLVGPRRNLWNFGSSRRHSTFHEYSWKACYQIRNCIFRWKVAVQRIYGIGTYEVFFYKLSAQNPTSHNQFFIQNRNLPLWMFARFCEHTLANNFLPNPIEYWW